ncbi:MAG: glycosyltransferase family 2 protein [Verrucomicrobiota bacterium]
MSAAPYSIVIPFYNEEACVEAVLAEVREHNPEAEIVAVDDGSADSTWAKICAREDVAGLRLSRNSGQGAAMLAGLRAASAPVCVTMDGDGQNDPADIPHLLAAREDGAVVLGYRRVRKDTWSKRAASKIANRIRRAFIRDGVRDTGCSLKVFPKEAVELLLPFNGVHRFMPALFIHGGYRMIEVPVNHRGRIGGTSKYTNWERALRGLYDLIGVGWLLKRRVHLPDSERSH